MANFCLQKKHEILARISQPISIQLIPLKYNSPKTGQFLAIYQLYWNPNTNMNLRINHPKLGETDGAEKELKRVRGGGFIQNIRSVGKTRYHYSAMRDAHTRPIIRRDSVRFAAIEILIARRALRGLPDERPMSACSSRSARANPLISPYRSALGAYFLCTHCTHRTRRTRCEMRSQNANRRTSQRSARERANEEASERASEPQSR